MRTNWKGLFGSLSVAAVTMSLLLRFGPGKAGAGSGRDRDIHNARNDRRRLRLHSLLVRNGDGLLASLVQRRAACAEYVERAFLPPTLISDLSQSRFVLQHNGVKCVLKNCDFVSTSTALCSLGLLPHRNGHGAKKGEKRGDSSFHFCSIQSPRKLRP